MPSTAILTIANAAELRYWLHILHWARLACAVLRVTMLAKVQQLLPHPPPVPIDPFPVSRPPTPVRVFFTRRTFAHAFNQKHITRIHRTTLPATLPRRKTSDPCQLCRR